MTFATLLTFLSASLWRADGFMGASVAGLIPRWPVLPTAAEIVPLPDPQSNQSAMWLLVALFGLLALVGAAAGGVLAILAIVDRLKGKRESVNVEGELHTKPSQVGPTRVEFEHHVDMLTELRVERKEDVGEMKAALKEIMEKLNQYSSDQYKARGRMHQRLNTVENALQFLAGKLAGQGDNDAANLRKILVRQTEDNA